MPIAPVFPGPSTGGGTDTDLAALSLGDPVDLTDGSWTLLDPDSLVKSTTHASGVNTVTFNALGTGDLDYVFGTNHADFRAPRWYRALNIGTTRVNSSALFIWDSLLDVDETVFDFNNAISHGVCADPTTTVRANIKAMGSMFSRNVSGNWKYGGWLGESDSLPSASSQYARCSTVGQYGAGHVGSLMYIILNSSDERVQNGSRNGAVTLSSTDMFEIVTVGTFNNTATIDEDDTVKFTSHLSAVRFTLP
jgi:hypothetical protein